MLYLLAKNVVVDLLLMNVSLFYFLCMFYDVYNCYDSLIEICIDTY